MSGSDYIEFSKAMNEGNKLLNSKSESKRTKGLYLIISVNLGLRIGDLLRLRHSDLQGESFTIIEGKTKKKAVRRVNTNIKDALVKYGYEGNSNQFIFISQKGSVYSRQAINRFLNNKFGISSHGLRKSFGRYVYDNNGQSEHVLNKLSIIFNHSNLKITRTYLGIRQTEIDDIFMSM